MHLVPSKCQMLIQKWISFKPNLVLASEQLGEVGRFGYFEWYISPDARTLNELSSSTQKACLAFTNLRFSWCRYDIRLSISGRVYMATVGSVLIYYSET